MLTKKKISLKTIKVDPEENVLQLQPSLMFVLFSLHHVCQRKHWHSAFFLPELSSILIILERCENRHPQCPPLGCQWSRQLLQVDLWHHRVRTIHLPPAPTPITPVLLNGNNDNTRTEMREDHMSRQIQELWRGFHSSISLDNLFTIPIITVPLGVGVCRNID